MNQRRFRGVYPILYAFFDREGRLDHAAMRAQVEHCIAQGAHGIAVLGLVTEVHRMGTAERQEVVELVGAAIAGRVPYAVTIAEQDPAAQIAFAKMAAGNGADWVILQPPPGKGHSEADLQRHFGAIADGLSMPVAIQNNPVNLDSYLSPEGLTELVRRHANVTLLKAEGASVDIARVLEALSGEVDAFGGHGGLEFIALIRSGGAGLIPAPDCLAIQVALYEALASGDAAALRLAEELHKEILPLVVFMTRSVPNIITYGKRVMAKRLGLGEVFDRARAAAPTSFGLAEMERVFADVLRAEAELLPALNAALRRLARAG
ncbi:dihydrodipicolinate synthase family protein [Bosea caraganae]|uniref:Dihydrodipicolinate synthase family protein n=1 Tax=Bosea caraganae TaxID=2763117 RepID=A0A370KXW1_9HYPH|nr:dihydrodipicolinate synthase family protein [Bosea caraganae]RDJ19817.1 dihydrodipicolinate synthase family protein [Bosea caraganae]RDJ30043.1 dihydrodipicolinate synthase family protein [Bosea caraganae]